MRTYTIGEVADRTGFTTSALRYYESRGLVAPATRTESGYRVYDDDSLLRLAFIARAKHLGCSLEEITDLAAIWDGEHCGPVQRRFHELVTSKIADAQIQIAELTAFAAQLQTAAGQLAGPASDAPCGDDCACVFEPKAGRVPVSPMATPSDPPIACTLDAAAAPGRVAEWGALLELAATRERTTSGALRIVFTAEASFAELTRLVAAEQACCAFFSFNITVDQRGIGLEVNAPDGADGIVTALFGATT